MRALAVLLLFVAAPLGAQTHCDVHYRWQEKTDPTRIADTVASASVSQMLTWSSPRCRARGGDHECITCPSLVTRFGGIE